MGVDTNGKDKELYEIVAEVVKDLAKDTKLRGMHGENLIQVILDWNDVRLKDKLPRTQKKKIGMIKRCLKKAVREGLLDIDISLTRFVFK